MLKIYVEFWGVLANKAAKSKETVVLDRADMDFKVVVEKICQGYGPDFRRLILDDSGELNSGLTILVDGKPVRRLKDFTQNFKNGSRIVFTYPLMGG